MFDLSEAFAKRGVLCDIGCQRILSMNIFVRSLNVTLTSKLGLFSLSFPFSQFNSRCYVLTRYYQVMSEAQIVINQLETATDRYSNLQRTWNEDMAVCSLRALLHDWGCSSTPNHGL